MYPKNKSRYEYSFITIQSVCIPKYNLKKHLYPYGFHLSMFYGPFNFKSDSHVLSERNLGKFDGHWIKFSQNCLIHIKIHIDNLMIRADQICINLNMNRTVSIEHPNLIKCQSLKLFIKFSFRRNFLIVPPFLLRKSEIQY